MKTYLVTGAAGFIGSALASHLIKEGNKVVTVDNLSTGYEKNIPEEVIFFKGSCQDYRTISQLEKYKFDAIFHIAGQSSGEISFDDPVYDLQTNTQSTLLLLKLALKINCKKFIYGSTMSVYGDKPDMPIDENQPTKPKSFYGIGKLASEHYLRIYQEYGINCIALRLFNVYGPGQNMQNLRQGMVSIFLAQAINEKHIHVKGSKERFRDFIYIDDVVAAFIASLKKCNEFGIYNIGTGIRTEIQDLILILKKHLPFSVSVKYFGKTKGDQFGIYGDIDLAKNKLDWTPKVTLVEGLKKMVSWSINNVQNE